MAVARLAAQDEARHVAFAPGPSDGAMRAATQACIARLAAAVHRRHDALRHMAGLNAEVFDALVLMASGSWAPDDLRQGHRRVMQLMRDMDEGRKKRLLRLGFGAERGGRAIQPSHPQFHVTLWSYREHAYRILSHGLIPGCKGQ